MPLVVEIWPPSTGDYEISDKLRARQLRGDLESWRLHPDDKTLIGWQRRPDGSDAESLVQGGSVQPAALPGVSINLDSLVEESAAGAIQRPARGETRQVTG
jgi:Uma2 family endonuclease